MKREAGARTTLLIGALLQVTLTIGREHFANSRAANGSSDETLAGVTGAGTGDRRRTPIGDRPFDGRGPGRARLGGCALDTRRANGTATGSDGLALVDRRVVGKLGLVRRDDRDGLDVGPGRALTQAEDDVSSGQDWGDSDENDGKSLRQEQQKATDLGLTSLPAMLSCLSWLDSTILWSPLGTTLR